MKIRKIKRKILRKMFASLNYRPTSAPFISGDGFRKMADHIHDEIKQITDTSIIKDGDIIFVRSDMLVYFFEKIHPNIKAKYKLISHNSDENITEDKYKKYLDEKIIHWFAQNLMFQSEKITAIPIGLENVFYQDKGIVSLFKKMQTKNKARENKVIFGFNTKTNLTERSLALKELREFENSFEIEKPLEIEEYLNKIINYNFIACPPGNGVDTHRTWEAICLDIIPIIKKDKFCENLEKQGLFLASTTDWKDLDIIIGTKYTIDKKFVYIDYWDNIIKNYEII